MFEKVLIVNQKEVITILINNSCKNIIAKKAENRENKYLKIVMAV